MSASEVVRRYASTLLDAADEAGPGSEAVRSDMEGLTATLAASGELREFLSNRLVDAQLVEAAREKIFADKVEPLVLMFHTISVLERQPKQVFQDHLVHIPVSHD